jgi:hypothetical protein
VYPYEFSHAPRLAPSPQLSVLCPQAAQAQGQQAIEGHVAAAERFAPQRLPTQHRRRPPVITETNRIFLVLFGMQNRTLGPYLTANNRMLVAATLVRPNHSCTTLNGLHWPERCSAIDVRRVSRTVPLQPGVLFCTPDRTNCILLVSVVPHSHTSASEHQTSCA